MNPKIKFYLEQVGYIAEKYNLKKCDIVKMKRDYKANTGKLDWVNFENDVLKVIKNDN